jgi:hypothetical protein
MAYIDRDGASWRAKWSVYVDGERLQRSRSFATRAEAKT